MLKYLEIVLQNSVTYILGYPISSSLHQKMQMLIGVMWSMGLLFSFSFVFIHMGIMAMAWSNYGDILLVGVFVSSCLLFKGLLHHTRVLGSC